MEPKGPEHGADRHISGSFFISDTRHEGQEKAEISQDFKSLNLATRFMRKAFPEILVKDAFISDALKRLKGAKRFSVLGMRVDPPLEDKTPEAAQPNRQAHVNVARAVERVCGKAEGFWGVLDHGLLAACFTGQGRELAEKTAKKMQEEARQASGLTLSVGIALFPQVDFDPEQSLENVRKSLDHAAYLGPEALVVLNAVTLNVSGDNLYQTGDVPGAIAEFERALQLDGSDMNVLNSLGVCHGVVENFGPAMECFERAAKLAPEDVMPVYNMGMCHVLQKEYEKALEYFATVLTMDEDIFEALIQSGTASMELKRDEEAIGFFKRAARLKPKAWSAHKYMGDCHAAFDRDKEAAKAYEQALRLFPHDGETLSALSQAYLRIGENPEIALSFARQAAELEPENGLFHHRLGHILQTMGRIEEALSHFEKAQALGHASEEMVKRMQALLPGETG